jgi:hypothetical protein
MIFFRYSYRGSRWLWEIYLAAAGGEGESGKNQIKNEKRKMKNGSCALRAILKRLRLKKEFLLRIVDSFVCVCVLFSPPKALINPSAGRSFHFDFLIFHF